MTYIFTDITGKKVIEIIDEEEWLGVDAAEHRDKLKRKMGIPIISWCHMGNNNPELNEEIKK